MGVPVLHCYADYKWTGPSEPIVRLCRELSARGWASDLACMKPPAGVENDLAQHAEAEGVPAFETFSFGTRPGLIRTIRDHKSFLRRLRDGGYGLVHCHGSWDHFIVGWATRLSGAEAPVLRTDHGVRDFAGTYLWRYYFGPKMIDHLIVLCDRYRVQAVSRLGLDPETVTTVRGAVDADEFRPMRTPAGTRGRFGFAADDVVIGIVARVQRHRRFEALLEVAEIVRQRDPRVKIAVCGRGTHRRSVLDRPLAKMGLQDTVVALGYLREDYREALSMFDAGLMLVPGSDGSCRAALQMAAMGKPLVVARRGVLPDIVLDGETGIVVYDTPENLAEAVLEMAEDPERRAEWGRAARERMCRHFSPACQADQVAQVYERLLESVDLRPDRAET